MEEGSRDDLDFTDFLFVTEVGSRMWDMAEISSDYDLFCVYMTPATDYLRTGDFKPTRAARPHVMVYGKEYDFQYMEIGHLVHLLMKGNVNAIWAVCSSVLWKPSPFLTELRLITLRTMSKNTYFSLKGMAWSQFMDAEKRKEVRSPMKSLVTCLRTLEFGDTWLLKGGADFFFVNRDVTAYLCQQAFDRLDQSYAASKLPAMPDPEPFTDFLYRIRMKEVLSNNIRLEVKR